jgi:hypothetical protein
MRHCRNLAFLAVFPLLSCAEMSSNLSPQPRLQTKLEGSCPDGALRVEAPSRRMSPEAAALWKKAYASLPAGRIPREGYVLETLPSGGALALASDAQGSIRARQSLAQLGSQGGARPNLCITDWPESSWRGLHVLDSGPENLPALKRLIHGPLARAKCNVLVYEIDYNFQFQSHPELGGAWTKAQVQDLVSAAREEGILVIPEINCLGHQSWKEPPGVLLKAHPEFEEPPDASSPQATLGGDFYCRSWCPLNPQLPPYIHSLIDEVLDAFGTRMFHAGMDEVFIIASKQCPRCKGRNPAELFALQVKDIHDHLKAKGATMLMWADRLLDGAQTGYGSWEASTNGTAPAIDLIPKDIILCDWHYEGGIQGRFPSLKQFTAKGFRVWPTVFKSLPASLSFMSQARAMQNPLVVGTLASVWVSAASMESALESGGDMVSNSAIQVLERAWNP